MFNKKCSKCKNKVKDNYDFCPFCANNLKTQNDKEDYGLIGKNDILDESMFMQKNSVMDKIFSDAFKMAEKILEKQMKNVPESSLNNPRIQDNIPGNVDIQFFVNGNRVFPGQGANAPKAVVKAKPVQFENKISEEKMKEVSKFPRKEAVSKVRRFGGRVIYELEVPGVDNIENILINQLENSIEIKALGKNKVYHKTLNINLPILKYGLNSGNLVLELAEK